MVLAYPKWCAQGLGAGTCARFKSDWALLTVVGGPVGTDRRSIPGAVTVVDQASRIFGEGAAGAALGGAGLAEVRPEALLTAVGVGRGPIQASLIVSAFVHVKQITRAIYVRSTRGN